MTLVLEHVVVEVPDGSETLTILDDVSLRVGPGEVVALSGASGSGKSTLLGVAGLLRRPERGTVQIAGLDTTRLKRGALAKLRRRHIGIVFQSSNLFPSLTALEQLELVAHLNGGVDAPAKDRARELLVGVGLESRLHARPGELSGGERQRVGIARALMNEPSLLLADEPTASLDAERGQVVMDLLTTSAREHDAAALIVTHAPEQVRDATRRLEISHGRVHPVAAVPSPS